MTAKPGKRKTRVRAGEPDITSLTTFVDFVERTCEHEDMLFRGQPVDEPLLPKIGRSELGLDAPVLATEKQLLEDFKRMSLSFLPRSFDDDWDWLAMAQHHGLPTRLLDWTQNPLAALWFAVENPPQEDTQWGVVWMLKTTEQDFADTRKEDPFTTQTTKVFRPSHITQRIVAQAGWFTTHKHLQSSERFTRLESISTYARRMTKLRIPAAQFGEIRYQLDRLGINNATLFPGLDGLCRHIAWSRSKLPDEVASRKDRSRRR